MQLAPELQTSQEEEFLSIYHLKRLVKIRKHLEQLSQEITETILTNAQNCQEQAGKTSIAAQDLHAALSDQD